MPTGYSSENTSSAGPELISGERGGSKLTMAVAGLALVGAGTLLSNMPGIEFSNPFDDGGESDPAAKGTLTYEGQHLETISDSFVMKIGEGQAIISMEASQDYDKPGWWLNGDFLNSNGTMHVRDPEDHDQPARLRYTTEYCADGSITVTEEAGQPAQKEKSPNQSKANTNKRVELNLGKLYVCDVEFITEQNKDGKYNAAAIDDDKVPAKLEADFETFVISAGKTGVQAAECPDDLDYYRSQEYRAFAKEVIANEHSVPFENVIITGGDKGRTDAATKRHLNERLRSFLSKKDPDSGKAHKALDIQLSANNGEGLASSCFLDTSGVKVDSLDNLRTSQP